MKRILLFISMLIAALVLVACNNTDSSDASVGQDTDATTSDEQDNNAVNQADNEASDADTENGSVEGTDNEMKEKMDKLDYTEIEIEVDYGKDTEYEAEIEQDNGRVEAELEDELNGDNLTGKKAFDKIYPYVEKLTITQDTGKDEAIEQTLEAFGLDADYVKFELELTLPDNTKIEIEDKK